MERRDFLKKAGAGTAVAAGTLAAPAIVKARTEIAMVTTWPRDFPGLGTGAQRFAESLSELSDGRLNVTYYASGERVKPFDSFDEVASGNAQMYHAADYYWKGKHPGWAYFTAVPFGFVYSEINAWINWGGGQELWDEIAGEFGLKCLTCGNTGVQMGGWFRKEINSVDDLKGLKMRIPGFAGEVLAELGVAVTNLPAGELYTALERGTIDALEWVGPGMDINMGFHKVAPYYYTGWHEPATDLQFLINQDAWNELPADLQAIVEIAMVDSKARMYWENFAMSAEAWSKMGVDYPNIKVKSFPPEVIAEMKAVNTRLIAETSAKDPMFKKIMDSQAEFMAKGREWTKMSDYLYLQDNLE